MGSRILVLILGFLGFSQAWASDILWLTVKPEFTYKDLSTACSTAHFPTTLYFGAEIDGGRVTRAVLKDNTIDVLTDRIEFLPEEILSIELYQDKTGRFWLSKLPLTARLLGWTFKNAGDGMEMCRPPQPIKTVGPVPFAFAFDTAGLGESLLYSATQKGTFKGQRKDGGSYVATLLLSQSLYGSGPNYEGAESSGNESATDANERVGIQVFSDRADCRAIAFRNPGLCKGQDCRGVLYHATSYCRSNDCRAMVRGLVSQCQTRDCRAVVYNNAGMCESPNCRAVLYGNAGLCR